MKIDITEEGLLQVKEVYNPMLLVSDSKQKISICMRDGGFEMQVLHLNGDRSLWSIQNGQLELLNTIEALDTL